MISLRLSDRSKSLLEASVVIHSCAGVLVGLESRAGQTFQNGVPRLMDL